MSRILVLATATALMLGADSPETIGAWTIKSSVDPMTDKLEAKASVYAADENALLSVGCWDAPRESRIAFFLTSDKFLGSSNSAGGRARREIMFRIDEEPAETLWWYYGDSTATQFTMSGVSEFGNILRRGSKLRARLVTYRGQEIDAVFDVSGASEAIDRIRLLCAKD